jgi:hypothetical protein
MHIDNLPPAEAIKCPVEQQCIKDHDQEQEKMQELDEMKSLIGIDALGWVPDDEQLEKSRSVVQAIEAGLREHSTTAIEQNASQNRFPFDDHDED